MIVFANAAMIVFDVVTVPILIGVPEEYGTCVDWSGCINYELVGEFAIDDDAWFFVGFFIGFADY